MNIISMNREQIQNLQSQIDSFLTKAFNTNIRMELCDEFCFAMLIYDAEDIIGCACVYTREMSQGSRIFNAAIVGLVAIDEKYRGQGLCHQLMNAIHKDISTRNIHFSFLFAYQRQVYQSSGYFDLLSPIHYFDKTQNKWNTFVYRGAMVKALQNMQLLKDQLIEFKGCVY